MIQLETSDDGVILPVLAMPGAQSNALRGIHGGTLKVAVTQIAEKGKANRAIVALLGKALKLRKSQIELVSGATSSTKRFLIRAITPTELSKRIKSIGE